MKRYRCAAALLALVVYSASAVAADPPLVRFSGDTDVVIRIKAPKETIEKVASMIDSVQPGFGAMVRSNTRAFGELISNPELAGVDQSKDWFIGVFTKGQDEPAVVFAVPTTDAEAAKAGIPEDFSSKAFGDWLFYSEDSSAIPAESPPSKGIFTVMKGEPDTVFNRGDISVFVNVAHLTSAYKDHIEEAQKQAAEGIGQALAQAPASPGVDSEGVAEVMKTIVNNVFQVAKDSQNLTVIANIGEDGILLEDYVSFTPSSPTATALADQPRSELSNTAQLPADSALIFGASANMNELMDWGMSLSSKVVGDNEQMANSVQQFKEAMRGVKFGTAVGSFSLGAADKGIFRYVGVTEVKPAQAWREAVREIAKTSGKVETQGITQETVVEPDAETIGGVKVDVMTIKQEFDESNPQAAMQKQMQQMMFGDEGIKYYLAYEMDKVIQTMGGGKDLMADALKGLKTSDSVQPEGYRQGLIPNPNLLVLVDLPALAIQAMKAASGIPGLPISIDADALDNIKLEKSYIGFSAAVEKDALRAKTRLPAEQFQSMMAVIIFFQQMQAQQLQQN